MIQRIKAFAEVVQQSKHPFKVILAQLLLKTGLHRYITIPMNGYRINFSRSALAATFFAHSKDRHEDEAFLNSILKPGQVYVDIGANIGTLALAASSLVGESGKVIAVEAHPATFNHLESNVKLNNFMNISLIHSAVGSGKGKIIFSNINSDDQNKVLVQSANGIEVKLDTLDNLLSAEPCIDVLKIDVEGYEKFVLEGATDTLKKTNIVYFESWEKHFREFEYSTGSLLNTFYENGFVVYKIAGNQLIRLPDSYKSLICENLIAIKDTMQFCLNYGYTLTT